MDGVDAVLADFSNGAKVAAHYSAPYPVELLTALRHAAGGAALSAAEWLDLDHQVGLHFAQCAKALLETSQTQAESVTAIGCHGQTVWHQPQGEHPNTWQIGNANIVAANTGIATVADLRRMDMAHGGQGAPLVPAFHADLFSNKQERRAILNLGGIANITVLAPGQAVTGYDTGPANCLLDTHFRHCFDKPFDEGGEWARSGTVDDDLLAAMLSESYFKQAAPKSTGPEHFSWGWVQHYLKDKPCDGADLQATLTELTARSVAQQLTQHNIQRVIACGGGVRNPYLMERLSASLNNAAVLETTDQYGIDPQHIEALAFAWLAKQRIEKTPGNMPSVTGASQPCPLGAVYLPH